MPPRKATSTGKRRPSEWNDFVKYNRDRVSHLPNNKRFAALAKMWAAHKVKHGKY